MEKILQLAKGKGLILSIDSNSGKYTVVLHEHESKFLEEFMITSNLLIMSEATDIPTFETTRGRSWIDLTLCNNILATKPVDARAARKKPAPTIRMYFSLLKLEVGGNAKHYPGKLCFTKTDDWVTSVDKLAINLLANFNCRNCPSFFPP